MRAKRAGQEVAGLPAAVSGQLVAAMEELENNIHEHADAPETGMLAYRAEPGAFEFVVADRGIGVLRSLRRCATYAALPDEGKALEAALTDGVSRHGPDSNHGHGFRPIFTGLMNLHGELRFRSGDHAVHDGRNKPHARHVADRAESANRRFLRQREMSRRAAISGHRPQEKLTTQGPTGRTGLPWASGS